SRLSGVLKPDVSFADIIDALFPCGSITGAPKIEAMKTVAEIEGIGRGPYCGAIGYLDAGGGADFSVAIRTLVIQHSSDAAAAVAAIPVGGGVTAKSDPQVEYEETLWKARSILRVLCLEGRRPQ
ncbi:MAG: chorismate-binding protein, partial [Pseudomonadota bacterium]